MTAAKAICWIVLYWVLVLAPVGLMLAGTTPPAAGFTADLSAVLGYVVLSILGVQFLLTARFRRASAPFGIDVVYYFHRYVGILALVLAVAHGLLLLAENPALFAIRHPWGLPLHLYAAILATGLLAVLLAYSLWRKELDVKYGSWRNWHGVLAVAVVLLGTAHAAAAATYLDASWKRICWLAVTLFWPLLLGYVRLGKPWRREGRPYRVAEVRPEHGNAWTLALVPEGHAGFRFSPGQFAWLTLGESPFSIEEHPFSISSASVSPGASGDGRIELTIKELGDFTRTVKDVPPGTKAFLDGPYGAFSTDRHPNARGYVFVAGGVGIAPVMSMLRTLAARGDVRPLCLFYGTRNWDKVIFREELEQLRSRLNLRLVHLLEDPPDGWSGETGYLTRDILSRWLPEERGGFEYFICGPVPLIRTAESALDGLGVPLGRIHTELYDLA